MVVIEARDFQKSMSPDPDINFEEDFYKNLQIKVDDHANINLKQVYILIITKLLAGCELNLCQVTLRI